MINLVRRSARAFATLTEATIELVPPSDIQRKPDYNLLPEDSIPTTTTVTRTDLLKHFKELCIMRNMEIQCDILYKAKKIIGFCHLYDGQVPF